MNTISELGGERHSGRSPSVVIWGIIEHYYFKLPFMYSGQSQQQPLHYGGFWVQGTALSSENSKFRIWAGQCLATCAEYCASLLRRAAGITASLACMFARYVAHRTFVGWLVGNLFVMVLQQIFLALCGLAYKTCGRRFLRKISTPSLIPYNEA